MEFPGISLPISHSKNAGNIKFSVHFVMQGGSYRIEQNFMQFSRKCLESCMKSQEILLYPIPPWIFHFQETLHFLDISCMRKFNFSSSVMGYSCLRFILISGLCIPHYIDMDSSASTPIIEIFSPITPNHHQTLST